ncbi:MAG: NAD(P)-binding domain-containing protein [Candidatus Delongbacteria bacterium]
MSGEALLYLASGALCALVVWLYLRREARQSGEMQHRLEEARARGLTEPASLHPRIDPGRCIGSGACVRACPEKHVLGLVNNRAVLINASACIGHGACEAACPVEAIDLVFGTARRGVDLPRVRETFETNVPGISIAGELGGMGLIRNAVTQGRQAVEALAASLSAEKPGAETCGEPRVDLLVVGAGPAGISAALAAQRAGLSVRVLEQDSPGGTILNYPRRKLVMTQPMCLPGESPWLTREVSKEELLERFQTVLEARRPEIRCQEQVLEVRPESGGFRVLGRRSDGARTEHAARRVLLAIGRRGTPRRMGVPGEELPHVHYQLRDPDAFGGESCVVVGGGDSAIEAALRLAGAGAAGVALVHRSESFSRARPANQEALRAAQAQGTVRLHLNSRPLRVLADGLEIEENGAPQLLPAGLVLVQIGGELPTGLLQQAGIIIDTHFGQHVKRGDAA